MGYNLGENIKTLFESFSSIWVKVKITTNENERTLIASCIPFCGWSFVVKQFFWFYVQTKMTKSAKNEQMGDFVCEREGQGCDTCDADASKQGRGVTLVPRVQTANSLSNDLDKYDSTRVGLVGHTRRSFCKCLLSK